MSQKKLQSLRAFDWHSSTPYPFGRMSKGERHSLRVVIHDGASIGEILLLLLVNFSSLDVAQVGRFLGLTQRRTNDLLRSVNKRVDDHFTEIERQARIADMADAPKRGLRGHRTNFKPKERHG